MQTPIETLLDKAEWQPVEHEIPPKGDFPYATHSGVLKLFDIELRCYRLNTGRAVLHADDVKKFFGGMIG